MKACPKSGHLVEVCEGLRPYAGGFIWKYVKYGEVQTFTQEDYNRLKCASNNFTRRKSSHDMHGTGNPRAKSVNQYTVDMRFIAQYETITSANIATGIGHIDAVCCGKRKFAGGFIWRYADKKDEK